MSWQGQSWIAQGYTGNSWTRTDAGATIVSGNWVGGSWTAQGYTGPSWTDTTGAITPQSGTWVASGYTADGWTGVSWNIKAISLDDESTTVNPEAPANVSVTGYYPGYGIDPDGFLANDSTSGGPLSFTILTEPEAGIFTVDIGGGFTWDPDGAPIGRYSFTYQLYSDGVAGEIGTVLIDYGDLYAKTTVQGFIPTVEAVSGSSVTPTAGSTTVQGFTPTVEAVVNQSSTYGGTGTVTLAMTVGKNLSYSGTGTASRPTRGIGKPRNFIAGGIPSLSDRITRSKDLSYTGTGGADLSINKVLSQSLSYTGTGTSALTKLLTKVLSYFPMAEYRLTRELNGEELPDDLGAEGRLRVKDGRVKFYHNRRRKRRR